VDVPLADGDTCTVMAHQWVTHNGNVVFSVITESGLRETARLPVTCLDPDIPQESGLLPDLLKPSDEQWAFRGDANGPVRCTLRDGSSLHVLKWVWRLCGPDVEFGVLFHGNLSLNRNFDTLVLRFPLPLLYAFNPPLKYAPAWVDVPLETGDVCTVMAHEWTVDKDEVVFRLMMAEGDPLEVVRLPVACCDPGCVAGEVPDLRDDGDRSWVVWLDVTDPQRFALCDGSTLQVRTFGWWLEGPTAVFQLPFRHWMGGELPALRFPEALLHDFNGVRRW